MDGEGIKEENRVWGNLVEIYLQRMLAFDIDQNEFRGEI